MNNPYSPHMDAITTKIAEEHDEKPLSCGSNRRLLLERTVEAVGAQGILVREANRSG